MQFFHFFAIIYINWYERLYHWCTNKILMFAYMQYILGSSFALCITREKYWVYEKNAHLCAIFSILHSNWNHCWLYLLLLMHPKKFDVEYNKKYIGSCASSMYDGTWISDTWKICSFCAIFWFLHSNWNHCCVFLLSFYNQDILTTETESWYKWHCVCVLFEVRWIWSRAGMHWNVALSKICLFNMSDRVISSPA